MKTLILGSEGQIGQYLKSGVRYDVAISPTHDLRSGFDPYQLDGIDFVYFLAFDVGGSTYLAQRQQKSDYIAGNVEILRNVFTTLEQTGTPFLFASSQMSNMLDSSYGVLKRLGEMWANSLNGINVRFWNVYGMEHDPAKFHVITDFVRMAIDPGTIQMRTVGDEQRQFLYGPDCAAALEVIAERHDSLDRGPGVYYDITSFEWRSILNVADLISELTGANVIPGKERDRTQSIQNQPTETILDFWRPSTPLADGIAAVMEGMSDAA